jgi:hypothetical protein
VTSAINRYYDPTAGQFTSVDPMVIATGQAYSYAAGNPVNGMDPLGLWPNWHSVANAFDITRHTFAAAADYPASQIIGAGYSIYASYNQIYQDGANGCSVFSSKTLGDIGFALFGDVNAALVADGGVGPEEVNLATEATTTHILMVDATGGGHLWPGLTGKTSFPLSWSSGQIMNAVSDIATSPTAWQNAVTQGSRSILSGTEDGVEIRVIVNTETGDIISGYPTNLPRNP